MKIDKSNLQAALEKVKPGLANKEIIEQSTSFAFMGDRVVTYNDEISISCPLVGLGLTGAVSAEELYKFLSKASSDTIEISANESELLLTAGKAKAGLTFHTEVRLPIEELGKVKGWKPMPGNLLDALQFVHWACSKDMSRPVLTCIQVQGTEARSCDNFRATVYQLDKKMPVDCLIPVDPARELIRYKPTDMTTTKGWLHFKEPGGLVFSCRTFADNYPDLSSILKLEDATAFTFPAELMDVVERARIFTKQGTVMDEWVVVAKVGRKLVVTSKSDHGWFEEWTKADIQTVDFRFLANPSFLQDVLKRSTQSEISPDSTRMKFVGDGWIHVMSLRVEG